MKVSFDRANFSWVVRIRHRDFETIGSKSLLGALKLGQAYGAGPVPGKLLIIFEETSKEYRKKHGPEILLVPEYVPCCLIQDILTLIADGCEVSAISDESMVMVKRNITR